MKKQALMSIFLSTFLLSCQIESPTLISHMVDGYFIGNEFVFPMNTITQLRMYYQDQYNEVNDTFDDIVISLSEEVDRYHTYPSINNLKTINDSCGTNTFVNVSSDLFELLEKSIEITKLTKGKFNLAMGNIIDLYSNKLDEENVGKEDELFSSDIIKEYLDNIPPYTIIDEIVVLDYENKAVKLNTYNDNLVKISLGAIAKGFVMQKAYDYLKSFNYPALFDAGNSTMATINQKSKKDDKWNIDLRSPSLDYVESLLKISLTGDNFISTSGDYQKYFKYKDDDSNYKLMHHIIDPNTGISNDYLRSVTVISKTIGLDILDALTTAIFNCYSDEEVNELIITINEHYNGEVAFLLVKPYVLDGVINYNKFNVVCNGLFDDLINGTISNKVVDYSIYE